jgi:hypothetical protein
MRSAQVVMALLGRKTNRMAVMSKSRANAARMDATERCEL